MCCGWRTGASVRAGDPDGDGRVDLSDVAILQQNGGLFCAAPE
jgi:hypothetical protein